MKRKKKRIRVGKLATMQEVAKFQARVIKKAVQAGDGIAVNDSYKLVMMASMLTKTLEISDLEARLKALESKSK